MLRVNWRWCGFKAKMLFTVHHWIRYENNSFVRRMSAAARNNKFFLILPVGIQMQQIGLLSRQFTVFVDFSIQGFIAEGYFVE